jgi:hypothetical protein
VTDLVSYSVQVPSSGDPVVLYPPQLCTTTTVPDPAPTLPRTYQEDATVGFQVSAGGGNLKLGSAVRAGWVVEAGREWVDDDPGKDTVYRGLATSGTLTVEVLVRP